LFCTSAFLPKNDQDLKKIIKENSAILKKLDDAASNILTKSLENKDSQTIIITNA
jgi:hypothetical protein